jgi:hypothetical protein
MLGTIELFGVLIGAEKSEEQRLAAESGAWELKLVQCFAVSCGCG